MNAQLRGYNMYSASPILGDEMEYSDLELHLKSINFMKNTEFRCLQTEGLEDMFDGQFWFHLTHCHCNSFTYGVSPEFNLSPSLILPVSG